MHAQSCPNLCDLSDSLLSESSCKDENLIIQLVLKTQLSVSRLFLDSFTFDWCLRIKDSYMHIQKSKHTFKFFCILLIFLLHWVFIAAWTSCSYGKQGLLSSCGSLASHCDGFFCCGTLALERLGFKSCSV